jgi:hypothetical protein
MGPDGLNIDLLYSEGGDIRKICNDFRYGFVNTYVLIRSRWRLTLSVNDYRYRFRI